ncbi:hypothetical protein Pint_10462 [Pistacia integerrima]|uniref:Uncharacterized protein n=1 Tax=Pistacia integerrima TaxID=434235 RepID=A0ACC0XH76_9ROSI|nr:hypothetical protein Pint_10462 [Pistacia integerrima]
MSHLCFAMSHSCRTPNVEGIEGGLFKINQLSFYTSNSIKGDRLNGVVALKQSMKLFQGYIRGKKPQSSESELWLMPFLIRYWRANSDPLGFSKYELGKSDWGWSWKERWIAARPWESRVPSKLISPKKVQHGQANKVVENINSPFKSKSPKKGQQGRANKVDKNINSPSEFKSHLKVQHRQASKVGKNINSLTQKSSVSVKPPMPNGRGTTKGRRLSFPAAEKPSPGQSTKAEETNTKERTTKGRRLSFPAAEKPSPGGNAIAGKQTLRK